MDADLSAAGANARGLLAQSIGGGGGNGGINISGGVQASRSADSPVITFGMGGFGGAGNVAGNVDVVQLGNIFVEGADASGIIAQSIGGGGGAGGLNVTGSVAAGDGFTGSIGIGGFGGSGADAGRVDLESDGDIAVDARTLAQFDPDEDDPRAIASSAHGILAQSVGGGGGNAGVNVAVAMTRRGNAAVFGMGGSGGAAGDAAAVSVRRGQTNEGSIVVAGDNANGLTAQSIGGGGGNASYNAAGVIGIDTQNAFKLQIGGQTGSSGDGDAVDVVHAGDIRTMGVSSHGLFAQSVGGGGGSAQMNVGLTATRSTPQRTLDLAIGAEGSAGGVGGAVSVDHRGDIATDGDDSAAIFAQSIGGGGGNAASNLSYGRSGKTSLSIGIGAEGGEGGVGGDVSVASDGALATTGKNATGILAQSVGGGGGASQTIAVNFEREGQGENASSLGLEVAVGLKGAAGGEAGVVDVAASGSIVTMGENAHGVHAQSIGGGGGIGGAAAIDVTQELLSLGSSGDDNSIAIQVGGDGGDGARSDHVSVLNSAVIITEGRKAFGLNAQSIGGGGGFGGMALNGALARNGNRNNFEVAVGGDGGTGGVGGDVSVVNEGVIRTSGAEAVGIQAQSIGGGGGDAGLTGNLNVAVSRSNDTSNSLILNIGGDGGTGGVAGDVSVVNRLGASGEGGRIITEGREAHGVFAQSVGGGGGNGSSVVSANFTGGQSSILAGLNIGGAGGTGDAAGRVDVENAGAVDTFGDGAVGVFAQSIGGGGGNGGLVLAANAVFASGGGAGTPVIVLGGSGGDGADAAAVAVDNSGVIQTRGANAHGIVAQSIGGGGGNAGVGVAATSGGATTILANTISAILGGTGGTGGLGGEVTVNHSGDITVAGDGAQAIKAESINGGGGGVVLDFNGITSLPGESLFPFSPLPSVTTEPVLTIQAGGDGVVNADAGAVTVNVTGTFGAGGDNGAGIGLLAVGGGGGAVTMTLDTDDGGAPENGVIAFEGGLGGENGENNDGGDVNGGHEGDIVTAGTNTPGVSVQSVGGGGGRGNFSVTALNGVFGPVSLNLGGAGGLNEAGGDINRTQNGSVLTVGDQSHAVMMQSVGGGGGSLSFDFEADAPPESDAAASGVRTSAVPNAQVSATPVVSTITLGAAGGAGLDGGDVNTSLTGDLMSVGANASALVLQSIGAGGGEARVVGVDGLEATIGGSLGAAGNGGAIDASNAGDVSATADRAHGVLLQSIGGGGGAVFTDVAAPEVILSADNTGDGGAVRFTQVGDIVVSGAESFGVLAQSLGGGGGFVDGAFIGTAGGAGSGASISLDLDGGVVADGEGSTAVFAQSLGADGAGNISIVLRAGHMVVGGAGGAGVVIDGGADNVLENAALLMTMDGAEGLAVSGTGGNERIVNDGLVFGDVDLGAGVNSFDNNAGAMLYSGAVLNLGGPDNLLRSDGVVSPGGENLAMETRLNGRYVQSAGASFLAELDFAADRVDSILATGDAEIDGALDLNLLNTNVIRPGSFQKDLFATEGTLTDNGLSFTFDPSAVIAYNLSTDEDSIALNYDVDFQPEGTTGNRGSLGDYFNRVQAAGSGVDIGGAVSALVAAPDIESYNAALTQLSPEIYAEQEAQTLRSLQQFSRAVKDCGGEAGRGKSDTDGKCVWARIDVDTAERKAADGFPEMSQEGTRFSGGAQYRIDNGVTLGFGLGYENHDLVGLDRRWRSEARVLHAGGVAKLQRGAGAVSTQFSIGQARHDTERDIAVSTPRRAAGERDLFYFSNVIDVSYTKQSGKFWVKPNVDLGVAHMRGDSLDEAGADGENLRLTRESETHVWTSQNASFGFKQEYPSGVQVKTFAEVGAMQYLTSPETTVGARFEGAPGSVGPFFASSDLDRFHFVYGAGVEIKSYRGVNFGLSYQGRNSANRENHIGSARVTIPF